MSDDCGFATAKSDTLEELRCATIDYAEMKKARFGAESLRRAFIGRLARMVKEACSANDLDKRIESIKSDQKRRASLGLIDGLRKALGPGVQWEYEKDCLILLFMLGKYYAKQFEKANTIGAQEGGAR